MPYAPTSKSGRTIIGAQRQIEASLNVTPMHDIQSSLNQKYNVFPTEVPASSFPPKIQYFGVGRLGFRHVDDGNLSEPHEVKSSNMDLYEPIPIRCVPIENDLSEAERANYRMRVVKDISGNTYAMYYLKKLVLTSNKVNITQANKSKIEEPYVFDYAALKPTPPLPSETGVIGDGSREINVAANASIVVLSEEIHEAINIIYGGDMRYATISELGLYMGEDKLSIGTDATGGTFNYTEVMLAQLAIHSTWNGMDMAPPNTRFENQYRIASNSLALI